MQEACDEIVKQRGGKLRASLAGHPVQNVLVNIADTFSQLQQARHDADYDLNHSFTRSKVNDLIALTSQAFSDWNKIRGTVQADVFLVALLAKRGMCR